MTGIELLLSRFLTLKLELVLPSIATLIWKNIY